MKKIFRPHIILLILGRVFTILSIAFIVVMISVSIYFTFFQQSYEFLFFLFFFLGLALLNVFVFKELWQLIWGKLIVKQDCLVWRCFFCRTVKIAYEDIKYVGFHTMGSENFVRKDVYHTGFRYILISEAMPPKKPIGKIFCKKGLIKWAYSKEVCLALKDKVPKRWKNIL